MEYQAVYRTTLSSNTLVYLSLGKTSYMYSQVKVL